MLSFKPDAWEEVKRGRAHDCHLVRYHLGETAMAGGVWGSQEGAACRGGGG